MDAKAIGLAAAALNRASQPSAGAIAIGDSITNAFGIFGWFELVCALSSGRFQYLNNAGVQGNTTSQMAARFDTDVSAYKPGWVFIMGSVNNIGAGLTTAQMLADYRFMIGRCRAIKARPIIVAMPTYNTAPQTIAAMNRALNSLALSEGVQFVDPWRFAVDTTNGHWQSTYNPFSDGTHPDFIAQRLAATEILNQISSPAFYPNLPTYNTDSGNLASNALFLNGAGTPTGWTLDAAFTPTLTAGSSPVLGNWFNLAFSSIAAYKTADLTLSASGINLGDRLQLVCRIASSGFETNGEGTVVPGLGKCDVKMYLRGTSLALNPYPQPSLTVDLTSGVHSVTGTVITQVPASLNVRIAIGNRSGTPSGTFSIAQLGVYNLGQ